MCVHNGSQTILSGSQTEKVQVIQENMKRNEQFKTLLAERKQHALEQEKQLAELEQELKGAHDDYLHNFMMCFEAKFA